ncbi:MAG: GNAT family N-acetyltransferase [Meiothermus sp.]|mgnify:CR=1 FL=1
MLAEVTTYYLETLSPADLRPKRTVLEDLQILKAEIPSAELQHFLYRSVGGDWYWYEKADWTYEQWLEYAQNPNLHTWVGYLKGTPAGYFQLEAQGNDVEITYFGLLPQFGGLGLGGHLLTEAIEQAWKLGPKRVWVHTCSLDSPAALANYQARGFKLYKTETANIELPERTPGPWNGSR